MLVTRSWEASNIRSAPVSMWIEPLRFHTPTDLKSALLTGAECLDRGLDGIEPHNSGEISMGIEPRADRSRSVVSDVVWEHVDAVE